MKDIELLELAAKAVGLNIKAHSVDVDDNFQALIVGKKGTREKIIWSPLADDGDALRLSVALGIEIHPDRQVSEVVTAFCVRRPELVGLNTIEYFGDDEMKATRRAIVRAAAEIGAM